MQYIEDDLGNVVPMPAEGYDSSKYLEAAYPLMLQRLRILIKAGVQRATLLQVMEVDKIPTLEANRLLEHVANEQQLLKVWTL